MTSRRPLHRFNLTALAAVLAALGTTALEAQVLEFDLDGKLTGRAGAQTVAAELGPGATLLTAEGDGGVKPGDEGPAVVVPVPDQLWRPAGTLAFRFRPSRTILPISDAARKPQRMTLVDCPALRADLSEDRTRVTLRVSLPSSGEYEPSGTIFWSYLKRGQSYHLALAWDATRGKLEAYLNGVRQQQMRLRDAGRPWQTPGGASGPLSLGGSLGRGDQRARIAVASLTLWRDFMNEEALAATLNDRELEPLDGEGRTDYPGQIDLSPYKLTPVYEADFSRPLDVLHEDDLCDGDRRVRRPKGEDWVLEGPGRAWTENDRLHLESIEPEDNGHVVLWNTRVFPEDFLLEFAMSPKDSRIGLNIVFLCASPRDGGDIFDLDLPPRRGVFKNYHSGALDSYHVSYWACSASQGGIPRRTCNVRKNHGFYLVSCGIDRIAEAGPGPHRVRVLKVGGKLRVETRGAIAAAFDDDGSTYGPVWGSGAIGLRQMGHTHRASYTHFQVWKVAASNSPD